MGRNVMVLVLVTVILGLMVSLFSRYYVSDQAFTPDNLVRLDLVQRQ